MKRIVIAILFLISCAISSCVTMSADISKPNGEKCTFSVNRLFWTTALYSGSICGAKLEAEGSSVDPVVKTIIESLLQAAKGATP